MAVERKGSKPDADESERFFALLATVVESWKLILIVPLLIGALTYFYLVDRPGLYRSDAILRLSKDEVAVLKSARVFGAAVLKVSGDDSPEAAESATVIVSTPDSPDVASVTVTYDSAAGAAAILQGMVDLLPSETMPSDYLRAKSASRIKVLNEAQTNLAHSFEKINKIYERLANTEGTGGPLVFGGDYGLAGIIAATNANDRELSLIEELALPTLLLPT